MQLILSLALGALAATGGAKVDAMPPAAEDAAAVVDAFHAALHRGDTRGAQILLSNEAIIFEEGGVELGKWEYAEHHLRADAEFARGVTSSVTRRSGGGDGTTAWVATEGRTSGSFRGKPINSVTTETMVLRNAGGGWKITHIHWSSREQKRAD